MTALTSQRHDHRIDSYTNLMDATPRALPYAAPTAEEVRAFRDFLSQEHPQILDAIERVADALVADGVDLSRLLDDHHD